MFDHAEVVRLYGPWKVRTPGYPDDCVETRLGGVHEGPSAAGKASRRRLGTRCGRRDAAVYRDDGAREVGTSPASEKHGDTRHVVVAAEPAQGAAAAIVSPMASSVDAIICDGNGPGATAFTVTCCGPSSLASTLVS
jgi:hypothetical protein